MNQVIQDRVARRWMQQLFTKKEPPLPQHHIPTGQHSLLEDLWIEKNVYEKVLRSKLIDIVKMEIPNVQRAETQVAQRAGIDPLFLNWFLVQGDNWPNMPKRTEEALRAIRSIYFWYGRMPSSYDRMVVPDMDQARDRDAALKALGDYFLRSVMPTIERKFTQVVFQESRKLKDWARERDIPWNKVPVALLRDFKQRVDGDRFQLKPAIQKVVRLFK